MVPGSGALMLATFEDVAAAEEATCTFGAEPAEEDLRGRADTGVGAATVFLDS